MNAKPKPWLGFDLPVEVARIVKGHLGGRMRHSPLPNYVLWVPAEPKTPETFRNWNCSIISAYYVLGYQMPSDEDTRKYAATAATFGSQLTTPPYLKLMGELLAVPPELRPTTIINIRGNP
jgi:hypothetical protein